MGSAMFALMALILYKNEQQQIDVAEWVHMDNPLFQIISTRHCHKCHWTHIVVKWALSPQIPYPCGLIKAYDIPLSNITMEIRVNVKADPCFEVYPQTYWKLYGKYMLQKKIDFMLNYCIASVDVVSLIIEFCATSAPEMKYVKEDVR